MKKLAFYPIYASDTNLYAALMTKALKDAMPQCEHVTLPGLSGHIDDIGIAWLNWFENVDARNFKELMKELVYKTGILLRLKIAGKRIVTIVHNRMPHEARYQKISRFLYRLLLNLADDIVVLSDDSIAVVNETAGKDLSHKITKISHPLYPCKLKRYSKTPSDSPVIAFFGLIRPYKNIELILALAERFHDLKFIIAGKVNDKAYLVKLKSETGRLPNISFRPGGLSDGELDELFSESDALILPYDIRSSLNSGVVYHGVSAGMNIIVPDIGTVNEFEHKDCFYHYTYAAPGEHLTALTEAIVSLRDEYLNNYPRFVERAEILHEEAMRNNSHDMIISQIKRLKL